MSTAQKLASHLLEIQAIKLKPSNPFTWASGLSSPIYCDNRLSLSHAKIRSFLKKEMASLANTFGDFDGIAGVATAGIAHGALVADELDKPFIYIRSKVKGHGRQNLIEGDISQAKKYIVVEDLISTGGSSIQAVEALRENGGEVVGVIALFSYGFERASEAFAKADCPFKTLSSYSVLLEQALEKKYINEEEKTILNDWNQDPQKWNDQFKNNKVK